MAAPQSKRDSSSSPSPSKPSNPRNSEIINPMRRSFTANPFSKQPSIVPNQRSGFNPNPNTPANSPSDYPRRNSITKESIVFSSFRDLEDKENSKDDNTKLGGINSPASLKGTKHFMSPTISAASKINASPRKKILSERNESVRTSISRNGPLKEDYSDFKPEKGLNHKKEVSFNPTVTYLEDKEEQVMNNDEDLDSMVNSNNRTDGCDSILEGLNQKKEVSFNPTITYLDNKEDVVMTSYEDLNFVVNPNNTIDDCDSFSESLAVENDFVNLDPTFKISPRASTSSLLSPALAPLDADPLMPPYDPKTNYLSPRPRFLHYKPNPRVELYLKQRDGKQLEESFASESSSDTEVADQETVSDESSLDSHTESEDAADVKVIAEEEEEELLVSEPNPIATFEGVVEARKVSKRHFLTRPKFTALLFVLALAGLWASVSNSPIMDPLVLNNLNFPNLYVPPEISQFTRENLEGLSQKVRQWLYDSLSYVHNLVANFSEWRKPIRLQFANLTILLEESSFDNYPMVEQTTLTAEYIYGEIDVGSFDKEGDQPIEADEELERGLKIEDEDTVEGDEKVEHGPEIEDEEIVERDEFVEKVAEAIEESIHDKSQEAIEASEFVIVPKSEEESLTSQNQIATEHGDLAIEVAEKIDIMEFTVLPSFTEVEEEPAAILNVETEPEVSNLEQPSAENGVSQVETEFKTERTGSVDGRRSLISGHAIIGIISLTLLGLLTLVPFIYMKNRTSVVPNGTITADQAQITKKPNLSPLTGSTFQERDVHTLGESCCPSDMSSFLYSSSYSKQEWRGSGEAQSQERRSRSNNIRRESMASSDCSMGSASYGSFTTYEKIQIKQGNTEGEFLTPVRRSTRIRKQVTSP
ncbi:hypothetical protein M5689_000449 [Euphorbia peplus]|nr:hypothetical protein M5689_000449 [Euphorbia peplus]